MQQAVLQVSALDHDMVGEHEATLERAAGDAAIQHLGLRGLIGEAAGNHQRVVLHHKLDVVGTEAGNRHGQAVAVVTRALDVVGRIGRRFGGGSGVVDETSQTVETDGGTEKRSEIESGHCKPPTGARSKFEGRPAGRPGTVPGTPAGIPDTSELDNAAPGFKSRAIANGATTLPRLLSRIAGEEGGRRVSDGRVRGFRKRRAYFRAPRPANLLLNLATCPPVSMMR